MTRHRMRHARPHPYGGSSPGGTNYTEDRSGGVPQNVHAVYQKLHHWVKHTTAKLAQPPHRKHHDNRTHHPHNIQHSSPFNGAVSNAVSIGASTAAKPVMLSPRLSFSDAPSGATHVVANRHIQGGYPQNKNYTSSWAHKKFQQSGGGSPHLLGIPRSYEIQHEKADAGSGTKILSAAGGGSPRPQVKLSPRPSSRPPSPKREADQQSSDHPEEKLLVLIDGANVLRWKGFEAPDSPKVGRSAPPVTMEGVKQLQLVVEEARRVFGANCCIEVALYRPALEQLLASCNAAGAGPGQNQMNSNSWHQGSNAQYESFKGPCTGGGSGTYWSKNPKKWSKNDQDFREQGRSSKCTTEQEEYEQKQLQQERMKPETTPKEDASEFLQSLISNDMVIFVPGGVNVDDFIFSVLRDCLRPKDSVDGLGMQWLEHISNPHIQAKVISNDRFAEYCGRVTNPEFRLNLKNSLVSFTIQKTQRATKAVLNCCTNYGGKERELKQQRWGSPRISGAMRY
ncbi:unnamed protein product [Amoebophrya sp. A25]|nr:unnamed protein product [Amoebophrya sp. A25]|eukprot:GSA25T00016501001.1